MNFDLTPDAQVDLLDIADTIAREAPERAVYYIKWGEAVRSARLGS